MSALMAGAIAIGTLILICVALTMVVDFIVGLVERNIPPPEA